MTKLTSPWRYPGGKGRMAEFLHPYLEAMLAPVDGWMEPFVGGGGLLLPPLSAGMSKRLYLNDSDHRVSAWWDIMANGTDAEYQELITLIKATTPTVKLHKEVRGTVYSSQIEAAFAGVFLNRTSFSGILDGSPIGGKNQSSQYTVDCRWNSDMLVKRHDALRDVLTNRTVVVGQESYEDFMDSHAYNSLVVLDPPYVDIGKKLYPESFDRKEHAKLAVALYKEPRPWLLTYNDHPLIREMYADYKIVEMPVNYTSVGAKTEHKKAVEIVIFHDPDGTLA
jgi:DNA adenine methylase